LLSNVSEEDANTAPPGLWRLAYPAPFVSIVRDVSDEEDVPDVLLLSVIRQESFFDPLAGSTAGALGLAQVIPATGETIAQDMGVEDFSIDDLYRPSVSLRFGAHYLGQQLDAFDGDVYAALAAYNGGPGNAAKWSDVAGGDPDRFLEEVEFDQTKAYLRLVSENLARYRQVYQGVPEPALPAD
jgi:soluble lytic murein transglycosylase